MKIIESCKMCKKDRKEITGRGKTLVAICDNCGAWRCLSTPFYPVEYKVILDAK